MQKEYFSIKNILKPYYIITKTFNKNKSTSENIILNMFLKIMTMNLKKYFWGTAALSCIPKTMSMIHFKKGDILDGLNAKLL